jgi:hypothetical protein
MYRFNEVTYDPTTQTAVIGAGYFFSISILRGAGGLTRRILQIVVGRCVRCTGALWSYGRRWTC